MIRIPVNILYGLTIQPIEKRVEHGLKYFCETVKIT